MSELSLILEQTMDENLIQVILSNPRIKEEGEKVKIRPIYLKEELLFQETLYKGTKVFHSNYSKEEIRDRVESYLVKQFKQGQIETNSSQTTILVAKKGNVTIKEKKKQMPDTKNTVMTHNRQKNYLLQEGEPIDFLVELGVMTKDGKVVNAKYDKFRQINRYLEFIKDVLPVLPKERTIRIIDFGCGKSYLTFAMYYFLHEQEKLDIEVVGLDLKEDVIATCSALAGKLKYTSLKFLKGDISHYEGNNEIDMVVTLHACDTATDYALEKAVKWGAAVILSVPCCQHEVNKQIECTELQPILKFGLLKERMSALITDGIRANLLEEAGYETQILEFIDMEHTPKNLLIRGVRKAGMHPVKRGAKIEETTDFLHLDTTLQKLFRES